MTVVTCPHRENSESTTNPTQGGSTPGKVRDGSILLRDTPLEGIVSTRTRATEVVRDLKFSFNSNEFFQVNPQALDLMVDYVEAEATRPIDSGGSSSAVGATADAEPGSAMATHQVEAHQRHPRFLVDAYCGVGLFAISLAKHFETVLGVEVSAPAVELATHNAAINSIANCTFTAGDSANIFQSDELSALDPASTVLVIDPSRKGCDASFQQQLLDFGPARVVYVSCNYLTQARDVGLLLQGGLYTVSKVQPVDLFPQTKHVENVITLDRTDGIHGTAAKQPQTRQKTQCLTATVPPIC